MKAFKYYGPGRAAIADIPSPTIGHDEILVAIHACGICGTDVKTYLRGHAKIPAGSVLGHEMAGQIISSNHEGFSPGQRVVVAPYAPCLTCHACQKGHFSLCDRLFYAFPEPGGFAELVRVPSRIVEQGVLPIPSQLDYVTASLTEPLACCLHGLEAIAVGANQSLLIIGDGPMGLLQAMIGKHLGASPVILSGATSHRLVFAASIADIVIDASATSMTETIASILPDGVDKVMVSVANASLAMEALSLLQKGGAINLFAGMPDDSSIILPINHIHYNEIKITGTFGFGPQHFVQALNLLASQRLPLQGFVTRHVKLNELRPALEAASRYEGVKAVVTMS